MLFDGIYEFSDLWAVEAEAAFFETRSAPDSETYNPELIVIVKHSYYLH